MESPPLGWHEPGVCVSGPADLLKSAVPGGTDWQKFGAVEVIVALLINIMQALSVK